MRTPLRRSGFTWPFASLALAALLGATSAAATTAAPGSAPPRPATLTLTILTPTMVFLGLDRNPLAPTDMGHALSTATPVGHVIAVTVMDATGPVSIKGSNHDHEHQVALAAGHMRNTPMPAGVTAHKDGWRFSYANTVLGRALDKDLPVVYTASMP